MKRAILLVVLLLFAAPVSAQLCREVVDANNISRGRICTARKIQGTTALDILRRLDSPSNALTWPKAVAPTVESGTNDAIPGALSWLEFPPERVRTKLDGSDINIPYQQLGPQWGIIYDNGTQSINTIEGPAGRDGLNGTNGADGPRGPRGFNGPQGIQGLTGRDGQIGPIGPQGSQGDSGPIGATGPQGTTGQQGIQGVQGPGGVNGINGINGATGATGPQGLTGPQGPQGQRGPRSRRR